MSGATVVGAAAFALASALVTESAGSAGGPVVPADRWQSPGLVAAIAKLRQGFIGADLQLARTLGQCFAAVGASRPQKNEWNRNLPFVDLEDCIGASEQFFEAMDAAFEWTDAQLAAGATQARGLLRLVVVESGGIGLPSWTTNKVAAARMRAGEDLPGPWRLTELGRQYRYAAQNYRAMLLLQSNGRGNPSHYLLATWWRQLWLTAEWADTSGAPLGGETWDEGGVWGSVLVGVQSASGWIASGFARVGGAVAGVIGDAAWAVIATPPGLLAVVAGVWFLRSKVAP